MSIEYRVQSADAEGGGWRAGGAGGREEREEEEEVHTCVCAFWESGEIVVSIRAEQDRTFETIGMILATA